MILKVFVHHEVPSYKILRDTNRFFNKGQFQIYPRKIIAPQAENYVIRINKKMITIILNEDITRNGVIKKYIETVFEKEQIQMYMYDDKKRILIKDINEIIL